MDRIVHRWVVDSFLKPYFETQFISTTYACIKGRGMHKATIDVQKAMKHCKNTWNEYYILKMDVSKYFQSINKDILFNIVKRKIKDIQLLELMKKKSIQQKKKRITNWKLYFTNISKYILK